MDLQSSKYSFGAIYLIVVAFVFERLKLVFSTPSKDTLNQGSFKRSLAVGLRNGFLHKVRFKKFLTSYDIKFQCLLSKIN